MDKTDHGSSIVALMEEKKFDSGLAFKNNVI